MRLLNDVFAGPLLPLCLLATLTGCGAVGLSRPADDAPLTPAVNGPAADYPVVIGEPYSVNGVTYTPADIWNYDEVGYTAIDAGGDETVSGAHHTLPLPSYVEVTSLETGKTILVRLERRGPMTGSSLVGLSAGAAGQLGAKAGTPVRVRRVNPPEQERALLRAGQQAPERMDTPMSLVNVLTRKLPEDSAPKAAEPPAPANASTNTGSTESTVPPLPPLEPVEMAESTAEPAPSPVPAPPQAPDQAVAAEGDFVVQAGAFSTRDRAERVAQVIGGKVSKAGSLYRVRTGPFLTRKAAEASLAKVKAAGYSDARIYSTG